MQTLTFFAAFSPIELELPTRSSPAKCYLLSLNWRPGHVQSRVACFLPIRFVAQCCCPSYAVSSALQGHCSVLASSFLRQVFTDISALGTLQVWCLGDSVCSTGCVILSFSYKCIWFLAMGVIVRLHRSRLVCQLERYCSISLQWLSNWLIPRWTSRVRKQSSFMVTCESIFVVTMCCGPIQNKWVLGVPGLTLAQGSGLPWFISMITGGCSIQGWRALLTQTTVIADVLRVILDWNWTKIFHIKTNSSRTFIVSKRLTFRSCV